MKFTTALLLVLASALRLSAASTIFTNQGNVYIGTMTNANTNGMKLWLDFDNITWTSATVGTNFDKSGYRNHAGAASGINKTNSQVPGAHGSAVKGQFANNYFQCRSDASLDDIQLQGGGGMTVSFWWNPLGASATIIAKGSNWKIGHLGPSSPFGLSFTKDCATTDFVESFESVLPSNNWYHCVITWDGNVVTNSAKLWVNGWRILSTLVTAGVGALQSDAAFNLTILDIPGNTATSGSIDELKIFNRILTSAEIINLYNSSRVSGSFPAVSQPYTATNIMSWEGIADGTAQDTTSMAAALKGAAIGSWLVTGAASDWTVHAESNLTVLSPITVAGVTYTSMTNALACRLDTGSPSALTANLVGQGAGAVSGSFRFKTDLRQIPTSGANFDIFGVGNVANTGVIQINEGAGDYFIRSHSVSNGVTYTGQRRQMYPYIWIDCAWLWETNTGKFHAWIYSTDDWPRWEERNKLILYSISPVAANSNATYIAFQNTPHGTARPGLTNYYKFFNWQYVTQTNAP